MKHDVNMQAYKNELSNYLRGRIRNFQKPIKMYGTAFQQKVWKALLTIPYGEVRSYTEIAQKIDRPKAVRAVANAIGQNPLLLIIPCHRVLRKDGSLSGFRAGISLKKKLLRLEGHPNIS